MNDASEKAFLEWIKGEYPWIDISDKPKLSAHYKTWQASRKQTLRDVLEHLPEYEPCKMSMHETQYRLNSGFNMALDEIRARIEKEMGE